MTHDDVFNDVTSLTRVTKGRSSEDLTQLRRLKVLEMYSAGLVPQIYAYVEGQGFSRQTASNDLTWAKQEWLEIHQNPDTVNDTVERHKAKYYAWAAAAEAAGDRKEARAMLQAVEKLMGLHQNNTVVQVNTGAVTNQTLVNHNYDTLTLEELEKLQLLLAKTSLPAADGS
ncbi:hypothetical protein [Hymenobacter siberiensis]|uniref:hypothetical protein n=1 Tax=Hymenobacter siberiensis TaxID=2848396 RepID=UPI001C1E6260|nr:hypothetical protein [Hymenobacter siberiensis]